MEIAELLQRASALRQRQRNLLTDAPKASWYRIENADDEAELYIYDEIGFWGVTANEFAQELRAIKAERIVVHLNSPGGDVFAGIAIFNSLKSHSADIDVQVDALGASIASVIAMAGDHIAIAKNAQMMIHDAHGFTVGNADDHREMADLLDASSQIIAEVYADRAGGTVDEWRTAMKATTWYRGAEAVTAGLADDVYEPKANKTSNRNSMRPAAKANEGDELPKLAELLEGASLADHVGYKPPLPDLAGLFEKHPLKVGGK